MALTVSLTPSGCAVPGWPPNYVLSSIISRIILYQSILEQTLRQSTYNRRNLTRKRVEIEKPNKNDRTGSGTVPIEGHAQEQDLRHLTVTSSKLNGSSSQHHVGQRYKWFDRSVPGTQLRNLPQGSPVLALGLDPSPDASP